MTSSKRAKILKVNHNQGTISINYIHVIDETPIVDLKAYFPVCDRVKDAFIPKWLSGCPEWLPEEGLGL